MLKQPLEQFHILVLLPIHFFNIDFSITNFFIMNLVILLILKSLINNIYFKINNKFIDKTLYFISNSWQKIFEIITEIVSNLLSDNLYTKSNTYFPILFTVFNFILLNNLISLIPYSFSTTSHILVTFTFSFSICLGILLRGILKYRLIFFSLFLPKNSNFFLSLIIVPIEFISYIARPISLGMRLFINLMAGHSLLKISITFAWNLLVIENIFSFSFILPILGIIILFILEFFVSLIQALVFILLILTYIKETLNHD
jgi:ATP synthase subunit 6